MASILPGYEYDIFISYRHNDNRSGWVTEFVSALKTELASTIKEPLSVYFDSNPHDGLLETHHVDKSLEGKLKSVILIPIISQTYCDTKSFAWQNEFSVFNKQSQSEAMGRDIKLGNGNVASRILPVRIHDLDPDDQRILETEMGSALRSVEFIYKEPGVNRPLKLTDSKTDNQNKTDYRNQLNKVANAMKEIIYAIVKPSTAKHSAPSAMLSVAEADSRTSIAVLPFTNLSRDPEQEYFSDGITENIISELASNKSLRLISRTSAMRYKNADKSAVEIAQELNVQYILEGGVQSSGKKVRINVQLVDAEKDDLTWSKVFVESLDDIFELQNSLAAVVAKELNASISPNQANAAEQHPTQNLEAYNLYLKGRHAFNQWGVEGYKIATDFYKKAIAIDPDFKLAYSALASSYSARMSWNGDLSPQEAMLNIEKYLAEAWKRGPSDNDYLTKAFIEFFIHKNFEASEQLLLKALELGPNNADILYTYSYLLNMMGRYDEAMQYVSKAKLIDPLTVAYFNYQAIGLHVTNRNEEALNTVKEGLQLYPSVLRFYDHLARVYLTLEKWADAEEAVLTGFRMSTIRPPSMVAFLAIATEKLNKTAQSLELIRELETRSNARERGVNVNVVYIYSVAGNLPAAEQWLNKAKQNNDVGLIWWQVDPLYDNIRNYLNQSRVSGHPDFARAERHVTQLLEAKLPHLPYHNYDHIKDVLEASVIIAGHEQVIEDDLRILRVAALMHDAGFIQSPKNHEEHGAAMAREILPQFGFGRDQIQTIENMILATRLPQSPTTHLEKILCDADLDYLGREDFYITGGKLFQEMLEQGAVENEREWNLVQRTFLQSHRFQTNYSKTNRESSKQERLQEIIAKLKNRS